MHKSNNDLNLSQLMFAGGTASCLAEIMTMPIDTVKVRMQLYQGKYKGFLNCFRHVVVNEGPLALYNGLSAALMRQITFASLRIGLFDHFMQNLNNSKGAKNITIFDRIYYGILTGGFAICVANPFDVLKVRFQADLKSKAERRYKNVLDAALKIYKFEGAKGFYQSLAPNILRNSLMNATELASYSQVKDYIALNGIMKDGILLHFIASAFAGLMSLIIASPADVIKSRMMDGKLVNDKKILYGSIGEAIISLWKEKGFRGFYAGFNANFQRLVSWNVIMFIIREQILKYMKGSKSF